MKVNFQGEMVEASEVEVLVSSERWNEYQLADGKVLMFKEVLIAIFKLEGKTNPDGTQAYQFRTSKVVRVK